MNLSWLNYHHLYYFYVIAREGTISKAAEKLNIGQSTLSTQLKLLEDNLGRTLFERRKQRLSLTEAGRTTLEYAEEIFRLGNEMVEAINDKLLNDRVHVQVGALDSVPKTIARDLILKAYSYGNCSVSLLEGKGDELFRSLRAHQIDLIVSNFAPNTEEDLVFSRNIGRLPTVVCGAPSFAGLKKNFPQSLDGKSFVFPTRHSKLRQDLDHYFKVNQIRADIVAETQDTSIQTLLGASGVGLVPLSEVSAQDLIRDQKLVILGRLPDVFEDLWLISSRRKIENPIAAQLMKNFHIGR